VSDLSGYRDLIASKRIAFHARGIDKWRDLSTSLFPHQRHGIEFALRGGCAALFYDTGLGKTAMALEWGQRIVEHTNRPVLMLAPLAVGHQHVREAGRLGIDAVVSRGGAPDANRIHVVNYDRLDRIDPADFGGVILDESSILKSFTGQTTRALTSAFSRTNYRLACTATPAPNDHTELGTHSEFLGIMRREEMLPVWFIHDSADTGTWRIKGHARDDFWQWVASWARCVSKPSDLSMSDDGFVLPELVTTKHEVRADTSQDTGAEKDGQSRLFRIPETSATSIHREKRMTRELRADKIAEIVHREPGEPWIIWCETNDEADALLARMPASETVEVRGQQSPDEKEAKLTAFSEGKARIIITKASIAGFGLNWQHCARQAFIGLSFSYEQFYQAVRRSWRFGQKRPVHVHIACADTERAIFDAVTRKAEDHGVMKDAMSKAMREASKARIVRVTYQPQRKATLPAWVAA
jgi:hypothetical protein